MIKDRLYKQEIVTAAAAAAAATAERMLPDRAVCMLCGHMETRPDIPSLPFPSFLKTITLPTAAVVVFLLCFVVFYLFCSCAGFFFVFYVQHAEFFISGFA